MTVLISSVLIFNYLRGEEINMAVRIRLQRRGRRNRAFYWIVVADSRSPVKGKFIEKIGYYDPLPHPPIIEIDIDKAVDWLNKGATPSETVRALFKKEGVLYKRHLMRGVSLGKITKEQAEKMFEEFLQRKREKKLSEIKKQVEQQEKLKEERKKIEQERYRKREERLKSSGTTSQ